MKREFCPETQEWMDRPAVEEDRLKEALVNLERLNRFFGGRKSVQRMLDHLIGRGEKATVIDLAAGYADHDRHLADRSRRAGAPWRMIALDFQLPTLRMARAATAPDRPIYFVQADARRLPFRTGGVDYAYCSLALHHFSEEDAVSVLEEMRRVARHGAVCIDLVRSRLAALAIGLLTATLFRDPMTRVDARMSVRRAFTHKEMRTMATRAGWRGAVQTRFVWFQQAVRARFAR